MESESSVPGNVGRFDEAIRFVVLLALVGAVLLARNLDVNWAPILVLPAMALAGYLLLTSFVHVDPVYMMLGLDTRHAHHR